MKNILGILFALLFVGITSTASALTVTFNDTTISSTYHGINGVYTESGFTFTATGSTIQFSVDPTFHPSNGPLDGTDFNTFESGANDWALTSSAPPFSLNSFQAAAIYGDPAGTLTVTGNLSGGGIVVAVLNLPADTGTAVWTNFILPASFTNLTSVDFDGSNDYIGIDNVVVNALAAPAQAVPTLSVWALLLLTMLLGIYGFVRNRNA